VLDILKPDGLKFLANESMERKKLIAKRKINTYW